MSVTSVTYEARAAVAAQAAIEPEPEPEPVPQTAITASRAPPNADLGKASAPRSKLAAKKLLLAELDVGPGHIVRQMSAGAGPGVSAPSRSSSSSSSALDSARARAADNSGARGQKASLSLGPAASSSIGTMSSDQGASFEIAQSPGGTPAWVSHRHGVRLTQEGELE